MSRHADDDHQPEDAGYAPSVSAASSDSRIGRIVDGSAPGRLLVDFVGNSRGPLRARTIIPLDAASISGAVAAGREVLLVFDEGDPLRPIIVGILDGDPDAALFGRLLVKDKTADAAVEDANPPQAEALLDGRAVILEGKEEVVLRCGQASITLRRDGKIFLKGVYIEIDSAGVSRIKGGAVKIN